MILAALFLFLRLFSSHKGNTNDVSSTAPTPISESQPEEIEATPSSAKINSQKVEEAQISGGTVFVKRVVDGDTIEIDGGQKVRYIGIDTPETVDPNRQVGCYGKEASERNKELVEGKQVRLEKDVSETDKYGRLLRYVWMGDILINELLVRDGYAKSSTYPPDVKYQEKFLAAERKAREEEKGLWGQVCTVPKASESTSTKTSPLSLQAQPSSPSTNQETTGSFTCNCAKTCGQMASCEEAYYQLINCGCSKRDGDKDGVPCEEICPGG